MSNNKRVERIMKKVEVVINKPERFKNPGLIISGLNILALKVELGE